jgi:hypothetical protein
VVGIVAGLDPGVDKRSQGVVNIQATGMRSADAEFVLARVGRKYGARPTDRKLFRFDFLRVRAGGSEIEVDVRVGAIHEWIIVFPRISLLEVLGVETTLGPPLARRMEAADEVGDGILILADGEPRKLDTSRLVADAGFRGIEAVVDIFGDFH